MPGTRSAEAAKEVSGTDLFAVDAGFAPPGNTGSVSATVGRKSAPGMSS